MVTTKSTTDSIIHGINILSLDHDYRQKQEFCKDNTSEVTVTNKTLPHSDWLDDIDSSQENYKHHSIIQSYLEPTCTSSNHSSTTIPVVTTRSKYSAIKSRVKRVFRVSKVDKQQILMQPSLPVFPANQRWTSPSIESMCSSTTTAAATSSSCSTKTFRNSCGLSTASFTKRNHHHHHKSVIEVKSCLKKRVSAYPTSSPRPNSFIDKKKRWSSIITPSTKKRFSHMILKRKKSTELFTDDITKGIKFDKYVNVHETWSRVEYDRSSDPDAVCTRLTPNLAQLIKQELNHYKLHEMAVHDSSRINTHFFL